MLIVQHGVEPIRPSRNDLLFNMLTHHRPAAPSRLVSLRAILTATISVMVSDGVAEQFARNAFSVGRYIFLHHIHSMLVFVEAQHAAGVPALTAMKTWYAKHDLDEDCFALDSAYKRWQRYEWEKEKKTDIFLKNACAVRHGAFQKSESPIRVRFPATPSACTAASVRFCDLVGAVLRRVPARMCLHGEFFFHAVVGEIKTDELARRKKVSRSTVYYGIAAIRREMDINPAFRSMVERLSADARGQ